MVRCQGKSWTDLLREHLSNARHIGRNQLDTMAAGKTVHTIIYDDCPDFTDHELRVFGWDMSTGPDQSVAVTGYQREDGLIFIDDVAPLMSQEIYNLLIKHNRLKKPKLPSKQPAWAQHNQAPRSVRKRR